MGLKCRIGRRADGTLLVTNENGTPSSLYQQALAYTKNEKDALEMWAVASTPDFVESIGKKGTVDDVSLESVIQYYNSNKKLIGTLTPSEIFEVKQMMADHNVGRLSEMAAKLKDIFYEGNVPNFYPERAIKSGLFTSEDVKNIDLARIGDLIMRMEADALVNDFSIETSTTSSGYRNPSVRNIFGASEVVPMEAVYQEVITAVENPQSEQEIRQAVQDLPYTDLVTKFNEDETFAEQFISKFKNIRKIPVIEERDGELVADVTNTFSTIKNTISTDVDQLDIEAEILYIEGIPANIWEESKDDIVEVIKEIEEDFADKNIDIIGLSEVTTDQATILRVLNAVNEMVKEPTNQNIQVFSDIYDSVFGKVSTKSVEKLPKELDGLTIVRMNSEKSDQQLFEQHGLIKVGDGLYHKVRTTDSLTDLYEAVYQQVKNGLVEIPERFNLTKDVNQKENTLKDIEKFINSRKTGLDFYNERASLYQVIFGHPTMDNSRKVIEDVKALAGVVTNVDYLKAGFISDFYNYILKEKLKNSAVYRNTLSKIGINNRDITIGNDISDLKNIEYYEELMDYLALKKDSTGKKYIAKEFKQEATNVLTAINFPQSVGEYNGVKNIVGNLMSIPRTVNNFVRVGDTLYQKVGENPQTSVFVKVRPSTDNLYYQVEVETEEYTKEQVERMKKQDMSALTQLTPEDIQQRNEKNGSLSKFVKTVKAKSIEYAKKVQANFQASTQKTESKSDIKFEQNLIEFIKQKGINVIADSKVFADKIKEMGFDSLNAMVQAWHGSPYSFDRFTTEKIGTGEGGQVFGFGLYFSNEKEVAKHYADSFVGFVSKDGKTVATTSDWDNWLKRSLFRGILQDMEEESLPKTKSNIIQYIEQDLLPEYKASRLGRQVVEDLEELLEDIKDTDFEKAVKNIYSVKIDSDNFLEWNSLAEANTVNKISNLLTKNDNKRFVERLYRYKDNTNITNEDVYEALKDIQEGDKNNKNRQASSILKKVGFEGVRVKSLDFEVRGLEDKASAYNYVVFDENAITIEEKIQFLQTPQGDILGFEKNGSIYLDPEKINNTTTLHELIHVFQSITEIKANQGDTKAQDIISKRQELFQDEATFWKEYHKNNKNGNIAGLAGQMGEVSDTNRRGKGNIQTISGSTSTQEGERSGNNTGGDQFNGEAPTFQTTSPAGTALSELGLDLSSKVYAQAPGESDVEYNSRMLREVEAFITAPQIAEKLENLRKENPSLWQQIVDFITNLTNYLKTQVGLSDYQGDILSMTKEQYIDALGVSVLKDDYKPLNRSQEYFTREADRLPLTLAVFENKSFKELRGKQVNPITIQNLLKQSGIKQIEKDLINQIIDENYQGQSKISYDELEATVRANIIPLENKLSFDFSDYGVSNLGLYAMYAGTYVLNSPVMHGKKGHFFNTYETETQPPKYEFVEITPSLFGAKKVQEKDYEVNDNIYFSGTKEEVENFISQENNKYLTKENLKQKGFSIQKREGTWYLIDSDNKEVENTDLGWLSEDKATDDKATDYLLQFYNKYKPNTGLYSHYRSFFIDDMMAIAEIQSDVFQKNMLNIKDNLKGDRFNEQFQASKKAWFERTVREAVKKAAEENRKTVLFPTPYIVAIIEKYITKPGQENVIPYRIIKSNSADVISIGDIVESKERGGSQAEVIEATKDTFTVSERGVTKTYKQPPKYGEINEEDFFKNIDEVLTPKEKTVVNNYKDLESFIKKEYGEDFVSRFEDEENNSWIKLDVSPQITSSPVVAFQASPIQPSLQKMKNDIMLQQMALDSRIEILILPSEQEEQELLDKMDNCGL